jgi:hypothetical protein
MNTLPDDITLEEFNALVDADIAKRQVSVIHVNKTDSSPAWTYTVGLTLKGLPEVFLVDSEMTAEECAIDVMAMFRELTLPAQWVSGLNDPEFTAVAWQIDQTTYIVTMCDMVEAKDYALNAIHRYANHGLKFLKMVRTSD